VDASGRRRIEDERDVLRNQLVQALERGMAVLPVLVDGARMPDEHDLPKPLARLARIHAIELRTDAFRRSSEEMLVHSVAVLLGGPSRVPASAIAIGIGGASLLVAGFVLLWGRYITPFFPHLPVAPGFFTGGAAVGVLAGALFALGRVSLKRTIG